MTTLNDIKPVNDTVIYLSDLKEGQNFRLVRKGYSPVYIYTQHIRVKTLVFKGVNGGELKLPEPAQFKLRVEIVENL